jgi:5'-methylthioadenosine phosphorylase
LDKPVSECRIGIIGGTGLADALASQLLDSESKTVNTPFGDPSGPLLHGTLDGVPIVLLSRHGSGHRFNPSHVPYRANIAAMKLARCTHLICSGATGSLREAIQPGSVVLCDQFIDRTVHRPRTFFDDAAVHVELADPCCEVMRRWLLDAAERCPDLDVHATGTYVCMEGPAFSTRAESHMHRAMGGDLIGMTAMPEAKLAREAELAYALVALPTDFDCWRTDDNAQGVLSTVRANLEQATAASITLIRAALHDTSLLSNTPSPAHTALNNAVWTGADALGDTSRTWLALLRPPASA